MAKIFTNNYYLKYFLFLLVFVYLSFYIKHQNTLEENFFTAGNKKFFFNLAASGFFYFFLPVLIGAGSLYELLIKKCFGKKIYSEIFSILNDNIILKIIIGFCIINIFGSLLAASGLLTYNSVIFFFLICLFVFSISFNLKEIKLNKFYLFIIFAILQIFIIYKYIYPELWSYDSYKWYYSFASEVANSTSGDIPYKNSFFHPWSVHKGNGQVLMWVKASNGDAVKIISIYSLLISVLLFFDLLSKMIKSKNSFFKIFFVFLSLLIIFNSLSYAEYQKMHFITLFHFTAFFWFLISRNFNLDKGTFIILSLIITSALFDKTYSSFYIAVIFITISLIYSEKIKFKILVTYFKFFILGLIILSFLFLSNWIKVGIADGFFWRVLINFTDDTVIKNIFDTNFNRIQLFRYEETTLSFLSWRPIIFEPLPIKLQLFFLYPIFLILNLVYLGIYFFSRNKDKYFIFNSRQFIAVVFCSLVVFLIGFILSNSGFTDGPSLKRYHHFIIFFGQINVTFISCNILFYFIKNISEKIKLIFYALSLLTVFVSLIHFDRLNDRNAFLEDNTLIDNRQIKYYFGKLNSLEVLNKNRIDYNLCNQVFQKLPENSTGYLIVADAKYCRGIPNDKNIRFLRNFLNLKRHLYSTPQESLELLKNEGFSFFVIEDISTKNKINELTELDMAAYYLAFDPKNIIDNFYMFFISEKFIILTTDKSLGRPINKNELNKINKLINIARNQDHYFGIVQKHPELFK